MPYMTIKKGEDGLWHHNFYSRSSKRCSVKLVGKEERIGNPDVATMQDPPKEECCSNCFSYLFTNEKKDE